jgi:hypothetical protein
VVSCDGMERCIQPKEVLNFATVESEFAEMTQYSIKILSLDLKNDSGSLVGNWNKQQQAQSALKIPLPTNAVYSSDSSEDSVDSSQSIATSTVAVHLMSKRMKVRKINMNSMHSHEV